MGSSISYRRSLNHRLIRECQVIECRDMMVNSRDGSVHTCQGATSAVSRSLGSRHLSSWLMMNTGWPLATSSPKLATYAGSTLQVSLKRSAKGCRGMPQRCHPGENVMNARGANSYSAHCMPLRLALLQSSCKVKHQWRSSRALYQ